VKKGSKGGGGKTAVETFLERTDFRKKHPDSSKNLDRNGEMADSDTLKPKKAFTKTPEGMGPIHDKCFHNIEPPRASRGFSRKTL
jgi:hypothetical protein